MKSRAEHTSITPAESGVACDTSGNRITTWIQHNGTWILLLLLLLFLLQMLHRSAGKVLWYDELFTWNLAQQPTWSLFRSGWAVDGNPPLLAILTHASIAMFGAGALATRLPSLIAYFGAAVILYHFIRRRLGVLAGLIGVSLFCTSLMVTFYAIEARPYALVLFFTILAMKAWQLATDADHPLRWAAWIMGLAISGALASHHLAIFSVGIPLFCGECVRSFRRRKLDLALIGISALGLLMWVFTIPLIRETQSRLLVYSNSPHSFPHALPVSDYSALVDKPYSYLALLVLSTSLLCVIKTKQRSVPSRILGWPAHEMAALVGSSLSLLVVFFVMEMTHGYYAGFRYGIGSFIGLVCLLTTLCCRFNNQAQALLVLLIPIPLIPHSSAIRPPKQAQSGFVPCMHALPNQPVVIARGLLYPEAWLALEPAYRSQLFYLTDLAYAKTQPYNIPEISMLLQQNILHLNLQPYHAFLAAHPKFLLATQDIFDQEYLVGHLKQDGAQMHRVEVQPCTANGLIINEVTVR